MDKYMHMLYLYTYSIEAFVYENVEVKGIWEKAIDVIDSKASLSLKLPSLLLPLKSRAQIEEEEEKKKEERKNTVP